MSLDVLFITPGNSSGIYQSLADKYAAIEPPTWALLLAQSCRSIGKTVAICDANAEKLDGEAVYARVKKLNPKLICFVVYGQNVNSGTVNMSGSVYLSKYLKATGVKIPIAFVGSHVQALPVQTLKNESSIDFAFTNEGVYALRNVLDLQEINNNTIKDIKGIVRREGERVIMNLSERIVPADKMDVDLPGYAWDLLPFKENPLDLYRAPMWHAEYDNTKRSPYAAIQTSLGCQFGCSFCMINILNRDDEEEVGVASNYSKMRHWSPQFILNEFDKLASLGVYTIKITDELFLFNKKYFAPLCEELSKKPYVDKLCMWAYSRVDTVKTPELLKLVRSAGIKWLALGIESGDKTVRLEVSKGKFEDVDIKRVVQQIHEADINVMGNYIFGLPGDTLETMRATLDLSKELCTAGWNAYAAMPLPGSMLYKQALDNKTKLPDSYEGFSFLGYDTIPIPTDKCTSEQILKFRDDAFVEYHSNPNFYDKIEQKFGKDQVENIKQMVDVKLQRKIISDS